MFSAADSRYLVFNTKCRILSVDPMNSEVLKYHKQEKYESCSKHKLLSYVTKSENASSWTLHVDKNIGMTYSKDNIQCCYSVVNRHEKDNDPDCCIK